MRNELYKPVWMIVDGNNVIVFDSLGGDVYVVDKATAKKIAFVLDSEKYSIEKFAETKKALECLQVFIDQDEFEEIQNRLKTGGKPNLGLSDLFNGANSKKGYSVLSMNISEKCNYNCYYCFGKGGSYGRKERLMSWKTAEKVLDYWMNNLSEQSQKYYVNFFGGEPFLNLDVLEKSIDKLNKNEKIRDKIVYILTTNGSIYNQRIAEILNNHNMEISFSIDGLEFIHNKNRPRKNGEGIFCEVIKNYHSFENKCDKLSVQMTITKDDIKYLLDSVRFLWKIGINRIHTNLVFGKENRYSEYDFMEYEYQIQKLTELSIENLLIGKNKIYGNLYEIARKIYNKNFSLNCFARRNHGLITSANGDVYNCMRI